MPLLRVPSTLCALGGEERANERSTRSRRGTFYLCCFRGTGSDLSLAHPMMQNVFSSERVADDVLTLLICAARAGVRLDLQGLTRGLTAAVELYEQYPTEVHCSRSEIRKLLAFIRQAVAVHERLDYAADEILHLQQRAEALRKPLH